MCVHSGEKYIKYTFNKNKLLERVIHVCSVRQNHAMAAKLLLPFTNETINLHSILMAMNFHNQVYYKQCLTFKHLNYKHVKQIVKDILSHNLIL